MTILADSGYNIVQKVTILADSGLPGLPRPPNDRRARPPKVAKAAKVAKVVILVIKVAYSQAGITLGTRFWASLGEIGALLLTFAQNCHFLSLLRGIPSLSDFPGPVLGFLWASWVWSRTWIPDKSDEKTQNEQSGTFCHFWRFWASRPDSRLPREVLLGPIPDFPASRGGITGSDSRLLSPR